MSAELGADIVLGAKLAKVMLPREVVRVRRLTRCAIDVALVEVKAGLHTRAVLGWLTCSSPLWHEQTWSMLVEATS